MACQASSLGPSTCRPAPKAPLSDISTEAVSPTPTHGVAALLSTHTVLQPGYPAHPPA